MDNKTVDDTLESILKEMYCFVNKRYKKKNGEMGASKVYSISSSRTNDLKIHLLDLYQKAFAQGVYTATWKGEK